MYFFDKYLFLTYIICAAFGVIVIKRIGSENTFGH